MAKRKWNLSTIYISERMQECLRPISHCALTTVVAPMGYGKTTAVSWYLKERAKVEDIRVVRISVYSDNLTIFWKSVQKAFVHSGIDLLRDYACPTDAASASLFMDELCHTLSDSIPCYIFIDDFHLLTDNRVTGFLCNLVFRLPPQAHFIIASRDRFLSGGDILRLGRHLHQITVDQLRLNHTELSIYAHRCGTELSDSQISSLLHSSEGWFSAVYLNLCSFMQHGSLPDTQSDIYEMFATAMLDPLPEGQREFLAIMGLADEFTTEMAVFITEKPATRALLSALTEQNAFVRRLSDGTSFRFHHMMKECAVRCFSELPRETQKIYQNRYGQWYTEHQQYLHAMRFYRAAENNDGLLQVVQLDAGILLSSLKPEDVLRWLDSCPKDRLMAHPFSILVLMRVMFNWKRIPEMLELERLLMASIAAHPEFSAKQRGNLLGERDLIMSFLMYNDISKMSALHRSASAQMTRPAISIQTSGGWTFGSPSVLMMFHRAPGALSRERQKMRDCMPHYYKITGGHGKGAETVMDAESEFMQGRFADAAIELERAYAQIAGNGQESIALCCDFLSLRLSLAADWTPQFSIAARRKLLLEQHNVTWVNIFDSICAYYDAMLGQEEQIPPLFREHQLSTVNFLAPGKPMMDLVENQVYLVQGAYAKVIARSEGLLAVCDSLHYSLVALHIQLQTAAAYEMLGKHDEAQVIFAAAIENAVPDQLLLPFVENYRYLSNLIAETPGDFSAQVTALAEPYQQRQAQLLQSTRHPEGFSVLTQRELELTELMAQHLSNKEIAQRLYLSEGTVKQYINQIYSKLQITGDTRTKRKELLSRMQAKT